MMIVRGKKMETNIADDAERNNKGRQGERRQLDGRPESLDQPTPFFPAAPPETPGSQASLSGTHPHLPVL